MFKKHIPLTFDHTHTHPCAQHSVYLVNSKAIDCFDWFMFWLMCDYFVLLRTGAAVVAHIVVHMRVSIQCTIHHSLDNQTYTKR